MRLLYACQLYYGQLNFMPQLPSAKKPACQDVEYWLAQQPLDVV